MRDIYGRNMRIFSVLKIVKAASKLGINKIRFTGGEPLVMIQNLIRYLRRMEEI